MAGYDAMGTGFGFVVELLVGAVDRLGGRGTHTLLGIGGGSWFGRDEVAGGRMQKLFREGGENRRGR